MERDLTAVAAALRAEEPPGGRPVPGQSRRSTVVWVLCLLAVVVGTSTWWTGSPDMVLTPDSGSYLSTAQNLSDGLGVTAAFAAETTEYGVAEQLAFDGQVPFTEWPPGYPVAIAVVMLTGASALFAAQLLNAVALAATAVIAALAVRRMTTAPLVAAVLVACVVLIGPVLTGRPDLAAVNLVGQSVFVLSESVYLALFLGAVLLGATAGGSRRLLVAAGVLVAAASLTRFVGVAAGVGIAAALLAGRGRGGPNDATGTGADRTASNGAVIGLLLAGPAALLAWTLLRGLLWGSGSGELLAWHPPDADQVRNLIDVVGAWFLLQPGWPLALRTVLVVAVAGVVTAVALVPAWRRAVGGERFASGRPAGDLLVASVVAAAAHLGIVLVTMTLLDANLPLTQRTLLPVQAVGYLVVAGLALEWIGRRAEPRRRIGYAAAAMLAIALCVPGVRWLAERSDPDIPAEIERLEQTQRAAMDVAARAPEDVVVVTNAPGLLWPGTSARLLLAPRHLRMLTHEPNPQLPAQLEEVGDLLKDRSGIVLLFPDVLDGGAVHEGLEDHAGLVRLEGCGGGAELFVTPATVDRFRTTLGC